jgi:hypothetical protein
MTGLINDIKNKSDPCCYNARSKSFGFVRLVCIVYVHSRLTCSAFELTKTVRNTNCRGLSATFWRNLFKVGDASTFGVFGTPNCGKGEPNQVITVDHASRGAATSSGALLPGILVDGFTFTL